MAQKTQKLHKGLSKRVRVTGRGKVTFRKAFNGHLRSHKTGAKIRQLRRKGVAKSGDIARLQAMLNTRLIPGDRDFAPQKPEPQDAE